MRIIFYNRAGVFFVSARLPCLPACLPACLRACVPACVPAAWPAWPACLAWPGLGLACWLAWLPGYLAAKNAQRRSTRQAHHIDAHVLLMARDCPLCKQA